MLSEPIATYRKSELRKPEVVEQARRGPVEIVVGASELLLLLPSALVARTEREQRERDSVHERTRRLVQSYLAVMTALAHDEVSPLALGDVGYIADWSADDRAAFAAGFGEALAESLRIDDPAPAEGYVKVMATRRRSVERPSAPWVADEHEALLPDRVRTAGHGTT